ncbi:hypothetical protein E8E13_002229 [Curvularia kusanoi]|uniref:Cyanovirin-N domain-containing protein n=1 Tax=Curvularia kusanoi TaxID=90978 RepID=A0A9P4T3U2_CURKU|nr:hypothetical protein E8E13_002229 [Curvularia kusanoi]
MGFSETCKKIKISSSAILSVQDPRDDGWFPDRICFDLDSQLGNDNGFFKLHDKNFSMTAKNIGMASSNPPVLRAKLKRKDGTWNEDFIDLDQFMEMRSGNLSCMSHKSPAIFLLELGHERGLLLDSIERRIAKDVKDLGISCLGINGIRNHVVTSRYEPGLFDEWVLAFPCFLFDQKYRGEILQSVLVDPIIEIIADEYDGMIKRNEGIFRAALQEQHRGVMDVWIRGSLREHVSTSGIDLATIGARAVTPMLIAKKHYVLASTFSNMSLKPLIKHLVHKILAKHIGSTLAKEAAKVGQLKVAGLMVKGVVNTAMLGYLIYKAVNLPRDMGRNLGRGVRDVLLRSQLQHLNRSLFATMAIKCVTRVILSTVVDYVGDIGNSLLTEAKKDILPESAKRCFKEICSRLWSEDEYMRSLRNAVMDCLNCHGSLHKDTVLALIKRPLEVAAQSAGEEVKVQAQLLLKQLHEMPLQEILANIMAIHVANASDSIGWGDILEKDLIRRVLHDR